MLDLGLTGKVAIVTGGSEGLGRATAMRFAQEGCHVVICARRKDVLERAAEAIRKRTGVQVLAQAADVTRPADVEAVVERDAGRARRRRHPRQQRGHLVRGAVREGGRRHLGGRHRGQADGRHPRAPLAFLAARRCFQRLDRLGFWPTFFFLASVLFLVVVAFLRR